MKKLILIVAIALVSCKKNDCYLMDNAGNAYPFVGENRVSWHEYISKGTTTINGNTYNKTTNPLNQICD